MSCWNQSACQSLNIPARCINLGLLRCCCCRDSWVVGCGGWGACRARGCLSSRVVFGKVSALRTDRSILHTSIVLVLRPLRATHTPHDYESRGRLYFSGGAPGTRGRQVFVNMPPTTRRQNQWKLETWSGGLMACHRTKTPRQISRAKLLHQWMLLREYLATVKLSYWSLIDIWVLRLHEVEIRCTATYRTKKLERRRWWSRCQGYSRVRPYWFRGSTRTDIVTSFNKSTRQSIKTCPTLIVAHIIITSWNALLVDRVVSKVLFNLQLIKYRWRAVRNIRRPWESLMVVFISYLPSR